MVAKTRAIGSGMIFLTHVCPTLTVMKGFTDNKLIYSQCRNGMGSPSVYMLVTVIMDFVWTVLSTTVNVSLAFMIMDLESESFLTFWFSTFVLGITVELVARFYSTENTKFEAIGNYVSFFSNEFMFMGMALLPHQTPWAFRWLFYILPSYWTNQNVIYSTFHWATLSGAEVCTTAADSSCQYHTRDGQQVLPGWKCTDGSTGSDCYGRTGNQVLESLHSIYEVASQENHLARNWAFVIAFYCLILLCYAGRLSGNAAKASQFEIAEESEDHEVEFGNGFESTVG